LVVNDVRHREREKERAKELFLLNIFFHLFLFLVSCCQITYVPIAINHLLPMNKLSMQLDIYGTHIVSCMFYSFYQIKIQSLQLNQTEDELDVKNYLYICAIEKVKEIHFLLFPQV
jgi:hypothetical protein